MLKKAVLKSFDSLNHKAVIQPEGSHQAYLEGVAVAANIPAAEMVTGRTLVVAMFDEWNPAEAVVTGVI